MGVLFMCICVFEHSCVRVLFIHFISPSPPFGAANWAPSRADLACPLKTVFSLSLVEKWLMLYRQKAQLSDKVSNETEQGLSPGLGLHSWETLGERTVNPPGYLTKLTTLPCNSVIRSPAEETRFREHLSPLKR